MAFVGQGKRWVFSALPPSRKQISKKLEGTSSTPNSENSIYKLPTIPQPQETQTATPRILYCTVQYTAESERPHAHTPREVAGAPPACEWGDFPRRRPTPGTPGEGYTPGTPGGGGFTPGYTPANTAPGYTPGGPATPGGSTPANPATPGGFDGYGAPCTPDPHAHEGACACARCHCNARAVC